MNLNYFLICLMLCLYLYVLSPKLINLISEFFEIDFTNFNLISENEIEIKRKENLEIKFLKNDILENFEDPEKSNYPNYLLIGGGVIILILLTGVFFYSTGSDFSFFNDLPFIDKNLNEFSNIKDKQNEIFLKNHFKQMFLRFEESETLQREIQLKLEKKLR